MSEAVSTGGNGDFTVFPDLPEIAEANLLGRPVPLEPDILPILEQLEAVIFAQRQHAS
jgi:hypothetical protein